jgi:hypothetical protein
MFRRGVCGSCGGCVGVGVGLEGSWVEGWGMYCSL